MAKTIKFNLICDGKPIRTLEDLRSNFSIEDVLEYYNNKLLHRWLKVRGDIEKLKKLEAINESEDLPVVKALINIFEVESDESVVEKDTYILSYKKEREALASKYEQQSYKYSSIIKDHQKGYRQLVDTIIRDKDDMAKIKAAIKEIDEKYHDLYELDYRTLFNILLSHAPLAIFAMLMRENMRSKYLPEKSDSMELNVTSANMKDLGNTGMTLEKSQKKETLTADDIRDYLENDKSTMYNAICELLTSYSRLSEVLGCDLNEFSGITDGYWKDVEPKGKRYLILKMESGNFIRSSGESGGDTDAIAINNNFVILDGIDYKSNNKSHKLLYMEV